MAGVVGSLLETLVEKLASGGMDLIVKYYKSRRIDPKNIDKMKGSLKKVTAVLRDSERQRIKGEAYEIWVKELQDLAYDLEDILDELVTDQQLLKLQQKDEEDDDEDEDNYAFKARNIACLRSINTTVKSILACGSRAMKSFNYYGSGNIPSEIRDIIDRLEHSRFEGQNQWNLSEVAGTQEKKYDPVEETIQKNMRETTSFVDAKRIFGREEKKKEVIQKLLKDESNQENYVVISIVGTGGMGKTTLAQSIYNDQSVDKHFEHKAWVCVSDKEFDVTRITTDMISSFKKDNLNFRNLELAQRDLREVVKGKKFLIVLDDVWTDHSDDWNKLATPLQCCARGSRVIVTTRHENVARMVSNNPTHTIVNLDKLSDNDCWNIFLQRLNQRDEKEPTEFKSDIIKKCDGLPLAAKALGDLFKLTVENNERQNLLDSDIWSEKGHVLPVLRLSYFHLPSHLKLVFSYCSILPKDYEFKQMEVILLWMAQGFLPENKGDRMEVIGHRYFLDLVQRSLFERSPSNEGCYIMHDLVHDLSQWAASDICCCVMDTKDMKGDLRRTRHLNLCTHVTNDQVNNLAEVAHQLRTFLCQDEGYVDGINVETQDFISKFRRIRTLSLTSETSEVLPECIGDLKHLRYLDLKFKKLKVFPKSIRKLYNLQVLFLSECYDLRKVSNISFLVELRHLSFPKSLWEMTPRIGKLTNLQTLGVMYVGENHGKKSMLRELKDLKHLHNALSIVGMENVIKVEDAKEAHLYDKQSLERLHFKWSGDRHGKVDDNTKRDVLEELKPNSCIKECELDGYMGLTLPSWLGDPTFKNMIVIKLVNCRKCEILPPMGCLPLLKKLLVEGLEVWTGWVHDDKEPFRNLEELSINECDSFNGNLPSDLPSLKIIRINDCCKARVSHPNSPHLEELEIDNCEALLSSTGDTSVICCSKEIYLSSIKEGLIDLVVSGPCHSRLYIKGCESLVNINKIPDAIESVRIQRCGKLERVEFNESSTYNNNKEVSIDIWSCDSLVSVENIPSTVGELDINNCKLLEEVKCDGKWNLFKSSEATHGGDCELILSHLITLWIEGCPKFISLPEGLLLPSIKHIKFWDNENQEALPQQIHTLTTLEELRIANCPIMYKFLEGGLDLLTHLRYLQIDNIGDSTTECIEFIEGRRDNDAEKVNEFSESYHGGRMSSPPPPSSSSCFTDVVNKCLPSYCFPNYLMSLPQPPPPSSSPPNGECSPRNKKASNSTLHLPTSSLSHLEIGGFENLKSINCSTFPHLTYLRIEKCPNLETLGPNNRLPSNLKDVVIEECPKIQEQCKADPNVCIRLDDVWPAKRYRISQKEDSH